MRALYWNSRTLALGLVFAIGGFCYAVSQTGSDPESQAATRGVGSSIPLRFTNPLIATDEYDLGDAAFASSIVRYITAEGGLRPYRFESNGSLSLDRVTGNTGSTLKLGLSGVVSGAIGPTIPFGQTTITGAPGFRFQVQLQDAKGTSGETRVSFYNLFLVNAGTNFRFAMDKLPDARLASTYVSRVEVVGGTQPFVFSLSSVTDATGGAIKAEDLGIFVSTDGTVFGRALKTGTFNLKIHCVDSRNQIADSRSVLNSKDQVFPLTVADSTITTSDLVSTSVSVMGDKGASFKDSIRYSGIANIFGQTNLELRDTAIGFRLNGFGFEGRLDQSGQFETTLSDGAEIKVKVATGGKISILVKKATLAAKLGAATFVEGKNTRLPLEITIGDSIVSSEVIDFETHVDGSRYALNYKLGREGSNAGGAFQITSAKGKDSATLGGSSGDAWKVGFLAIPRNGVVVSGKNQGLDNVTQATVRIGTNFTQVFKGGVLQTSKDKVIFGSADGTGVRKFSLNIASFKGQMQTFTIAKISTGIPLASTSPRFGEIFFTMGVDFIRGTNVPFTGEHARLIFGLKNQYSDVPPRGR